MGKWCLHASSFIFVRIIIKVAGNQDRHKSMVEFEFGPNQTTHFGVTCPWVTKISHFWTWISLKRGGQSWSNFMCSIIGVGERLHKVLGLIDLGTLDSGERSLPFGLLVFAKPSMDFIQLWRDDRALSKILCSTIPIPVHDFKIKVTDFEFFVLNLYSVSCCKAFDWFESCLVWMDIRF